VSGVTGSNGSIWPCKAAGFMRISGRWVHRLVHVLHLSVTIIYNSCKQVVKILQFHLICFFYGHNIHGTTMKKLLISIYTEHLIIYRGTKM